MVANKGRICTKIGCRFDEKHQMRQPLLNFFQILLNVHICILHFKSELIGEVQHYSHWRTIVIRRRIGCAVTTTEEIVNIEVQLIIIVRCIDEIQRRQEIWLHWLVRSRL